MLDRNLAADAVLIGVPDQHPQRTVKMSRAPSRQILQPRPQALIGTVQSHQDLRDERATCFRQVKVDEPISEQHGVALEAGRGLCRRKQRYTYEYTVT